VSFSNDSLYSVFDVSFKNIPLIATISSSFLNPAVKKLLFGLSAIVVIMRFPSLSGDEK